MDLSEFHMLRTMKCGSALLSFSVSVCRCVYGGRSGEWVWSPFSALFISSANLTHRINVYFVLFAQELYGRNSKLNRSDEKTH